MKTNSEKSCRRQPGDPPIARIRAVIRISETLPASACGPVGSLCPGFRLFDCAFPENPPA